VVLLAAALGLAEFLRPLVVRQIHHFLCLPVVPHLTHTQFHRFKVSVRSFPQVVPIRRSNDFQDTLSITMGTELVLAPESISGKH